MSTPSRSLIYAADTACLGCIARVRLTSLGLSGREAWYSSHHAYRVFVRESKSPARHVESMRRLLIACGVL